MTVFQYKTLFLSEKLRSTFAHQRPFKTFMTDSSDQDFSTVETAENGIRLMKSASVGRQLAVMLKVSFLRKFRAPTIWIELALPLLFLIFVCLFTNKVSLKTTPLQDTSEDQYVPYWAIPGPTPHYGIIPENENTTKLLQQIQVQTKLTTGPDNIASVSKFFKSFEEYKDWVSANRKVDDHFYAVEWINSDLDNATTNPDIRLSSNGMTLDSVPDFMKTVTAAVAGIALNTPTETAPVIVTNFAKMPMPSVDTVDNGYYLEAVIFCSVLFIPPILTAATYYGTEAETGLRDMFAYFGLSPSANRMRWYIECFTVCFVLSIPFCIGIWGLIKVSFWLLIVLFFLGGGSMTSITFFLISLYPTQAMGRVVGLGILLSFFVFIFWALFSWIHTEEGYYEKRIFSIFPQAAFPFTLAQIISGYCVSLNHVELPPAYPVRMGLIYLAVEMVVYYLLFVIVDSCKSWKWFPAPIKWGHKTPDNDYKSPIIIQNLTKKYGKETVAVDNISFEVPLGETLAIVGPNGAGKSTLMGLLSGSKEPTSGVIEFCGIDAVKNLKTVHRMVGLCPQDNLFMNELKATEWIETLAVLRGDPKFDYSDIFAALGLDKQKRPRIGDMSGGNKRKVSLASALICDPPIVILDEATSGVDFTSRTRIWSLISGLKHTTVIMATHTLEECEKIADRIMVLADGKISKLATPTELRQEFKCGYLIETSESNADKLREALTKHGFTEPVEVSEQRASVVLPAEATHISNVLKELDFEYLMSIQSLEEKIFSHIQEHELQVLLNRNKEHDSSHERLVESRKVSNDTSSSSSSDAASSIDQHETVEGPPENDPEAPPPRKASDAPTAPAKAKPRESVEDVAAPKTETVAPKAAPKESSSEAESESTSTESESASSSTSQSESSEKSSTASTDSSDGSESTSYSTT